MNDSQIDLAHAAALGSIGDEDRRALRELIDSADPVLRADFDTEVRLTTAALALLASASATEPPADLRTRLLAALTDQPDPDCLP